MHLSHMIYKGWTPSWVRNIPLASFKDKLRGHSWLLLDSKLLETAINVFDMVNWNIYSILTFLVIEEVLRLLHVFILSFKEVKRTFLTPDGMQILWDDIFIFQK